RRRHQAVCRAGAVTAGPLIVGRSARAVRGRQHIDTSHAIALVTLGGFGYLLKDRALAVHEFLDAAERVARGGSALDPQVVARLPSPADRGGPLAELSEREREVLALMAEGLTNRGIAKRLYLTERTVEAHVRHVLMKLALPEATTVIVVFSPSSHICALPSFSISAYLLHVRFVQDAFVAGSFVCCLPRGRGNSRNHQLR